MTQRRLWRSNGGRNDGLNPQLGSIRAAIGSPQQKVHPRSWSGIGWQFVLLTPPVLLYFLVRDLSADQRTEAFRNAESILDVERSLGLDWEAALQQRILDSDAILTAVNWFYIYGHFPLLITALFVLFRWSRGNYLLFRNALVASGAIGLVCFVLYPVAPPRLFDPTAFFDSLGELSTGYKILQNPNLTNQFAAVPSFHVGWNLLAAIAVWRASRFRPVKILAALSPMLMVVAVVLTANHWLLDIFAGIAVALAGIAIAVISQRIYDSVGRAAATRCPRQVAEAALNAEQCESRCPEMASS